MTIKVLMARLFFVHSFFVSSDLSAIGYQNLFQCAFFWCRSFCLFFNGWAESVPQKSIRMTCGLEYNGFFFSGSDIPVLWAFPICFASATAGFACLAGRQNYLDMGVDFKVFGLLLV